MDEQKQRRLEANGWRLTTVDEFLGLTPEESAKVDRAFIERMERKERARIKAFVVGRLS